MSEDNLLADPARQRRRRRISRDSRASLIGGGVPVIGSAVLQIIHGYNVWTVLLLHVAVFVALGLPLAFWVVPRMYARQRKTSPPPPGVE